MEIFPLRLWMNGGREVKRRNETEWRLAEAGIDARRFAAVDAEWVGRMSLERRRKDTTDIGTELADHAVNGPTTTPRAVRGYAGQKEYALALTLRLLLRRAMREGAAAVLILTDEVTFHPNFRALTEVIEVPDDWEMFHFGHTYLKQAPEPVAAGMVRVRTGTGFHAFALSAGAYKSVLRALDRRDQVVPLTVDAVLGDQQQSLRSYASFPNLAWRDPDAHIATKAGRNGFGLGGFQTEDPEMAEVLFQRMFASGRTADLPEPAAGRTNLGLLFLTRGDVNHPEIWREFVSEAPERVRKFCHAKDPQQLKGGFLEGAAIRERHRTAWGDVSLVRASLALLREALEDPDLTHFVLLSESCVPIRPLPEILRTLDWNPKSRFDWRELSKASATEKRRAWELPQVPAACWRFQSQWWLLDRIAAEWVARVDYTGIFARMEVPDEGYFSTVLCLLGFPLADQVVRKACTWTHWEGGPHPLAFKSLDREKLESLMESGAFFARKFPNDSEIGKYGLHRSRPLSRRPAEKQIKVETS